MHAAQLDTLACATDCLVSAKPCPHANTHTPTTWRHSSVLPRTAVVACRNATVVLGRPCCTRRRWSTLRASWPAMLIICGAASLGWPHARRGTRIGRTTQTLSRLILVIVD